MALMPCPDCGNPTSDQAFQCVKCGRPLQAARDAGRSMEAAVTTQQTAKRYKGQMAMALTLFCLGLMLAMFSDGARQAGFFMIMGGAIWYIVARAQAWWSNG